MPARVVAELGCGADAIGGRLAATSSIEGDQRILVLGIDLFDRIARTVILGLGHVTDRIRSLRIAT